jgi:HPt (histidine-containing phosphotransfer) domain-containing protein
MIKLSAAPAELADAPPLVPSEPAIDVPTIDVVTINLPAIDLAHLVRMTIGDRSLEREVLGLFDRQAEMLLARMQRASRREIAAFAHTLTGSARGIGAWQVAHAAEAIERAASGGEQSDLGGALARLTAAVEEARASIVQLLRR